MFKTEYYTKLLLEGKVLISCNVNANLKGVLDTMCNILDNTENARYHGDAWEFRRSVIRMFEESDFVIGLMSWKQFKKLPDHTTIPISTGKFEGIKKFSINMDREVLYVVMFQPDRAKLFDMCIIDIKAHHRTTNKLNISGSRRRRQIDYSDYSIPITDLSSVSAVDRINTINTLDSNDSDGSPVYTYTTNGTGATDYITWVQNPANSWYSISDWASSPYDLAVDSVSTTSERF